MQALISGSDVSICADVETPNGDAGKPKMSRFPLCSLRFRRVTLAPAPSGGSEWGEKEAELRCITLPGSAPVRLRALTPGRSTRRED